MPPEIKPTQRTNITLGAADSVQPTELNAVNPNDETGVASGKITHQDWPAGVPGQASAHSGSDASLPHTSVVLTAGTIRPNRGLPPRFDSPENSTPPHPSKPKKNENSDSEKRKQHHPENPPERNPPVSLFLLPYQFPSTTDRQLSGDTDRADLEEKAGAHAWNEEVSAFLNQIYQAAENDPHFFGGSYPIWRSAQDRGDTETVERIERILRFFARANWTSAASRQARTALEKINSLI